MIITKEIEIEVRRIAPDNYSFSSPDIPDFTLLAEYRATAISGEMDIVIEPHFKITTNMKYEANVAESDVNDRVRELFQRQYDRLEYKESQMNLLG